MAFAIGILDSKIGLAGRPANRLAGGKNQGKKPNQNLILGFFYPG